MTLCWPKENQCLCVFFSGNRSVIFKFKYEGNYKRGGRGEKTGDFRSGGGRLEEESMSVCFCGSSDHHQPAQWKSKPKTHKTNTSNITNKLQMRRFISQITIILSL